MQNVLADRIRALACEIRAFLSQEPSPDCHSFVDYHGFRKSTLDSVQMLDLALSHGFSRDEVQIELVRLEQDLSTHAHLHEITHAHVVILGAKAGFRNPDRASLFLSDKWLRAVEGMSIDISPGCVHGFTVEAGGVLDFLSIQSPPLVVGHVDDFIEVNVAAPERHPIV